eukprot:4137000-Amphidinium_carterae.2
MAARTISPKIATLSVSNEIFVHCSCVFITCQIYQRKGCLHQTFNQIPEPEPTTMHHATAPSADQNFSSNVEA